MALCLSCLQACVQAPFAQVDQTPQKPMAELRDTDWRLVELGGVAPPTAPNPSLELRITLRSEGARVDGFSGCNRFSGGYVLEGAQSLRFTPLAGTRMACEPPRMELEGQVHTMLAAVTAYRVEGERLTLLAGGRVLARLAAPER